MKYIKYILAALLVLLAVVAVHAQSPNDVPPVRWRTIVKMTSPTEGNVTFRALISQGWHLYGLEVPEGGPKATTFDLSKSTGVEFTGPVKPARAPLSVEDAMFGMTLTWWDSNVAFSVPFRLAPEKGEARIGASITYMSCDGASCRPPKTERISAPVPSYSK